MMSVLNQSGEDQVECPLCMEPFEVDDLNFFPCTCGYQICRFCWHRIRTDENGLCPACRKAYPENPADFKPLSQEEVARLKAEKRHKDQQRKQKITENRKHLANVRVVQRNLVFVVGLPMRLADAEVLKKHEYFGKFGKIHKVVINQSTSYAGSQGPSASAYVTYHKADDALRAIQAVNNISVDGRTIKTSLGTTKYCSHFMKNQPCPKPDCMYLHDLGDAEASFTKEEMQQGKHQEYEKKLHEQLLNTYNHSSTSRDRKPTPSPPAVVSSISSCQNVYQGSSSSTSCSGTNSNSSSAMCVQGSQACNKEAWPSLQPGLTTNSNTNGNNFGLSSSGSGNSSSNNNNNNNSNNNNNINSSKGEGSQRRQRYDQQSTKLTTNIHKKRHTSGEESRGKAKEKLQSSLQDEVGNTLVHSKSQHSNSRSLSSHDLHHNLQHSPRSSNNSSSSSSSDVTNGPTVEADSDVQESDDLVNVGTSCTVLGTNGRQQLESRILPGSHRTTLFEPDNNSFFSNNNFTKLATTSTGSATTDWPINGLTLTHMPDVLPPVHSSEDWQAAFGFTTSSNPPNSQQQENSCIVVTSNNQHIQSDPSGLSSKIDSSNVDHGFESNDQQQSQNFKNSLENKSCSVENVVTQFPPPSTSNLNEDFGVNTNSSGHLPQKIDTGRGFEPEEGNLGSNSLLALQNSVNPTLTSNSIADGTQQMFPHSPSLVHQDATILMMHHHQFPVSNLMNHIAGPQHMISNGLLPPSQATSKFLADFHMRQQQNQNLMKQLNSQSQPHSHLQNHSDSSFVGRNKSNVTNATSVGGKISTLGGSDFNTGSGGDECKVNSENNLHNGGDINSDFGISDEEKYLPGFLNHQQKNMESSIELEYESRDGNSMNLITATTENSEETSTKDSGRLTDDELGFDPFHETQKALAEMMEKENMVLMVQGQQNRQQPPHDLLSRAHLRNQHGTMSHLTHHLYQQCQLNQMGHFSHQAPHTPAFGGSKLLGSFANRSQQQILPQQNHRLPSSVSGCAKLLDGLGLGPSSVTPVGPSAPARTRLPPPGFTTAPNHMNAFGLGIPRAPSNNSSKILPFMGLGNNSSNNGSSSPIPQTVSNLSNNIAHSSSLNSQQGSNQQSVLFSSNGSHSSTNNHTLGLQNGGGTIHAGVAKTASESYTMKEWPENVRSLLPNLNGGSHSQGVQFASSSTPLPPPAFGAPHAPVQGNSRKGWSGVGPCTDWTTLDPAIVSSSRPQNYLAVTSTNHHPPLNTSTNPGLHLLHNTGSIPQQNKPPVEQQNTAMSSANPPSAPIAIPQLHQLQQNNVGQWLRSLSSEEGSCVFYSSNVLGGSSADWAASANHSGSVNGQQQQNHIFYGSNILGGGSADWAASSNHLGNANGQQQQNHLVGSPNSGSVTMSAQPPPGFSSMRLAAMQQGTATASCMQKKQCSLVNTDMGQIEIPDISQ